jgi:hypothetical protein
MCIASRRSGGQGGGTAARAGLACDGIGAISIAWGRMDAAGV